MHKVALVSLPITTGKSSMVKTLPLSLPAMAVSRGFIELNVSLGLTRSSLRAEYVARNSPAANLLRFYLERYAGLSDWIVSNDRLPMGVEIVFCSASPLMLRNISFRA